MQVEGRGGALCLFESDRRKSGVEVAGSGDL